MLPGVEMMACTDLAVPMEVMQHVVRVESSFNPYAIGVVGGRLVRQPRNLSEAVSTARMLENKGYNFSLGIAQVNRYNLASYGLDSYERAFQVCPNLQAGTRILAECHGRAGGDWGKAFSCYYSGNFATGFRHGYVQKVFASWRRSAPVAEAVSAIPLAVERGGHPRRRARLVSTGESLVMRRIHEASASETDVSARAQTAAPDRGQAYADEYGQRPPTQAQTPQPTPSIPLPTPSPNPSSVAPGPQPVLLQPHGAPPLAPTVAPEPSVMPPVVPASVQQQPWPQPATVDNPRAVGAPPPTVAARDEAFVF